MPLAEMYRTMLEAGNPVTWETNRQKQLMGEYELESKRRSMDAEQQLRDLYSSGGPVSNERVMAINPELGIKMQQFQNEQYLKHLQAQETQGKIDLQSADQAAAAAFPALMTYQANRQKGMPEEQALSLFHSMNGDAVSKAAQAGESWIQSGSSYDPKKVNPDDVRALNARFNRFTPMDQLQQKAMERQLPPGMSAEQYYGQYHQTPEGYVTKTPPMGGQAPRMSQAAPQPAAGQEDITEPQLQAYIASLPDGPDKQRLMSVINRGQSLPQGASSTVEVTPEELQRIRTFNESQKAGAKRAAELNVEEQQMSKKATNAYDMLPDPDRIRNLIKGSVSGDLEYWANRAGGIVGKSLEAGDMTGALKVIEGQMADTVAMFPGAQSDKELEARMKTIGNPSGEISADTRLKAFDEWQERMQKYAAQHADYDDTKLIDMVQNKKLTREQAMQIRKRRMSGSL